jgi:hypothetical protein
MPPTSYGLFKPTPTKSVAVQQRKAIPTPTTQTKNKPIIAGHPPMFSVELYQRFFSKFNHSNKDRFLELLEENGEFSYSEHGEHADESASL